jgi:diguanylate cyclase (GGDEF)-like protein
MFMRMSRLNRQLLMAEQGLLESNQHLRGMTVIDGLTGVGNRRKLDEFLANNWGQVCRNANPVCVMLLDIDYFKKYNDTYGHIAGDECLKKIANTISHLYRRSGELVIRYGGEEFLIMVVNCDPTENAVQAEQLRKDIENLQIEHRASEISTVVTASIGVVRITPDKDSVAEALIQSADQALYQAKRNGRNQVFTLNP